MGVDANDDPRGVGVCDGGDGRLPSGQGPMAASAERADTTAMSLWRQALVRSRSLGWCLPGRWPRRRADISQPRHQASENSGQARPPVTTRIIAVKAHSSAFASQVNRCETAPGLDVCCLLLSFAVPPGSAELRPQRGPPRRCAAPADYVAFSVAFSLHSRNCVRYLIPWGSGTTRTWAGRSRRRWSGARSCSASTWPASLSRPATSSPTSAPRHQNLEPQAAWSGSSGLEAYGRRRGAASTAYGPGRGCIATRSGPRSPVEENHPRTLRTTGPRPDRPPAARSGSA
jgi:hypothetical protein